MSLFRQQAVDYAARREPQGMLLRRPPLFAFGAWAVLALAAALITFAVFGTYSARIPASGVLRADLGMVTVVAPMAGVIHRRPGEEGDLIDQGQLLATIDAPRQQASGENLAQLVALQIDQRRSAASITSASQTTSLAQRERGLKSQLRALQIEIAQLQAELEIAKRQADLAQSVREKVIEVHRRGFVSDLQLQQSESDLLQRQAAVLAIERAIAAASGNQAQLRQSLDELPAQRQALNAELAEDLAFLKQEAIENDARGRLGIAAPVAGIVTAELVESGQVVQPGQALFTVLPQQASLQAQLLVPSRAVGFIERGDSVRLRLQSFPYQKFGHQSGTVARVSKSALGPSELAALTGSANAQEPLYRVIVNLEKQSVLAYGKEEPLLPGMALEADIMLESRRLIEWVLEPLYSLKGRVLER